MWNKPPPKYAEALIELGRLHIDTVLPLICGSKRYKRRSGKEAQQRKRFAEFFGQQVRIDGLKLHTFKTFGVDCIECGAVGEYFSVEATLEQPNEPYLALYAFNFLNKAYTRMTCDHIHARSLGGSENSIKNVQPLCVLCNKAKAKVEHKLLTKIRNGEKNQNA